MRTPINHGNIVTAAIYAKPLLNLDEGLRVEIMHILLNSISHGEEHEDVKEYDLYTCFKGAWGKEIDSEEYLESLREDISEPKEVDVW